MGSIRVSLTSIPQKLQSVSARKTTKNGHSLYKKMSCRCSFSTPCARGSSLVGIVVTVVVVVGVVEEVAVCTCTCLLGDHLIKGHLFDCQSSL